MPRDLENEYEIPEDHLWKLNGLCGLDQYSPQDVMPDAVRLQYIRDRVRADKIGMRFTDNDLWNIVCRSNVQHMVPTPSAPARTVFDLWKAGTLKHGDYVLCKWRKELDFKVPGKILGFEPPGRPIVLFVGDEEVEERILNINCVIPAPAGYEPPGVEDPHKTGKNKPKGKGATKADEQLAGA